MLHHGVVVVAILAGSLLWGQEAEERALSLLTRDGVWQVVAAELRQQGFAESELPNVDALELPVAVPEHAVGNLRVVSSCWDERLRRAEFRLECAEAGQCVSFFAYARMERGALNPCQAHTQVVKKSTRAAHLIHSGDRARVLFQGRGFLLSQQVTCLEHGGMGEVIRVRNQDGRIFRARVSGPARLDAMTQ